MPELKIEGTGTQENRELPCQHQIVCVPVAFPTAALPPEACLQHTSWQAPPDTQALESTQLRCSLVLQRMGPDTYLAGGNQSPGHMWGLAQQGRQADPKLPCDADRCQLSFAPGLPEPYIIAKKSSCSQLTCLLSGLFTQRMQ